MSYRWDMTPQDIADALEMDPVLVEDGGDERTKLRTCPVYAAVMKTVIERLIETDDDSDNSIREVEDDGLPWWNDRDERTEDEVLDILHTTAKRILGVGPDDAR